MRLFAYEWKKVFRQKGFLLLLAGAAVLNVIFLAFSGQPSEYSYTAGAYCAIWEDIGSMPDDEAYLMLEEKYAGLQEAYNKPEQEQSGAGEEALCVYTKNLWQEMQLIRDVCEEIDASAGYRAYLASIQEDAEQMEEVSIFQEKTAFSARNIQKTAADFGTMADLNLRSAKAKGVTMAVGFLPTDFIAVLLLFVFCACLILTEKQTGQLALIIPTSRGRRETLEAKTAVLFVGSGIIYLILYGGNFLSAGFMYGFGSLSRMVQTIPEYQSSVLRITVGGFFALFCAVKILLYFMSGLFILFFCEKMKKWMGVMAVILAAGGASMAACYLIPENSIFSSVRYLNLISFLRTDKLLLVYKNINLFGYPVSLFPAAITVMLVLTGIFFAGILTAAEKTEVMGNEKCGWKIRKFTGAVHTLCGFELLKLRKKCGLFIWLLLLILLQIFRIYNYSYFDDPDEIYYRSYMNYLSELSKEEAGVYVEEENARYEYILSQNIDDENSQELLPYKGWTDTLSDYERVEDDSRLSLLYPTGYLQLMGENHNMDMISVILLTIVLGVCLAGGFSGDYEGQINQLLSTAAGGKKRRLRAKRVVFTGIAFIIFGWISLSDFLMFYLEIGMKKADAPLQSIGMFAGCTANWKIWHYLVVLYCIRFFGMLAAVHGICFFSELLKDTVRTVLLSFALFTIPALMGLIGAEAFTDITLLPLFRGNGLLNQCLYDGSLLPILPYLICAGTGMVIVNLYLNRKYREVW